MDHASAPGIRNSYLQPARRRRGSEPHAMAPDSADPRASLVEFSLVACRQSPVAMVGCARARSSARPGLHGGNKLLGCGSDLHSHRVCRICPHVGARIAVPGQSPSILAPAISSVGLLSTDYFSRTPHVYQSQNWSDFDCEKNCGRFEASLRHRWPFADRVHWSRPQDIQPGAEASQPARSPQATRPRRRQICSCVGRQRLEEEGSRRFD